MNNAKQERDGVQGRTTDALNTMYVVGVGLDRSWEGRKQMGKSVWISLKIGVQEHVKQSSRSVFVPARLLGLKAGPSSHDFLDSDTR